jgi:Dyp-type peroxidase family
MANQLNVADIQGFVLRGYNFPFARYLLLELEGPEKGRDFIGQIIPHVTTGQRWENGKPQSTVNIAFTHKGLVRLGLPDATLLSFPVEFFQGMKARKEILCDTARNASENWDEVWRKDAVHVWLGVNALTPAALDERCAEMERIMKQTGGARLLEAQEAKAVFIDSKPTSKEHFGFTDGFGNPDFEGAERHSQPGQGKLSKEGDWIPLATGEFILGYADEAGELPVAPVPHLLANNGTFMVYRKLHQNVASFRNYLDAQSAAYAGGREKLAAKVVGRWRDGTPIELSPDVPSAALAADPQHNVNFTYGKDRDGARCPLGAHIRRANPRDSAGFHGQLVNRRSIARRGLPYGEYVPEGDPVSDDDDRGVIFMVLNASIFRQFEFVHQQWIEYGNDAHQGSDKDALLGNHDGRGRFLIQGSADPQNPPYVCARLPQFVELRGGDYFFMPSLTALRLMADNSVDPR